MRWAALMVTAGCLFGGLAGCKPAADAELRTTYDAPRGQTVLETEPLQASGGFTVTAMATLTGRATVGTPLAPGVVLTIVGPLDVSSHGTGDIVDMAAHFGGSSKRKLGRVDRDGRSAAIPLEPAAFSALAGSPDAALQVGASRIPLTPEIRAAFGSLARRFAGK